MPISFVNGGYVFSVVALVFALILTLYCIKLILEVREKLGGSLSFSEIGFRTYGRTGKFLVDLSLFGSQTGFTCAYIYFIASQITGILNAAYDTTLPNHFKWWFMPVCFVILLPLVMVRKIETFAKFHVFGDAMIFISLIVIVIFASASDKTNGFQDQGVPWFNKQLWPDSIGFAIYAFEGIGVILPVQDITADKEGYFKIICITCVFITMLYVTFSEFCLMTYYE